MQARFAVFLVALLFAAGAWMVRAQNPPAPQPLTLEKIKDDLYVILGDGGNAPVLLTDEGVILVDSKNERNHDDLVATVKTLTDKPIKYVISTHAHADHTGGNRQLLHDAQVIGHVNVRAAMTKGNLPGSPPLSFTDQMSIVLGSKEVDLRYFGRCHTDGDTFIYFPAERVLATGDCFNTGNGRGLNPTGSQIPGFYADYTIGGSFLGFANAADAALKLDWDTVIPGHGPTTNRAGFLQWRAAVDIMTNRMRSMVREGRTKTEIEDMLVNEFKWERTGMPFRSVEGMIAELKQ